MRKIYTAIAIMCFALGSFANQSLTEAQVSETLGTDILEFTITDQVTSTINDVDHTVSVTMPLGKSLTELIPTYTMSAGATSWIGTTQVSSTIDKVDFTSPVVYTIANGAESKDWTVTVVYDIEAGVMATFNVDMQCAEVGDSKVYVTGNFNGWNMPSTGASVELTDADGDKIYTGTAYVSKNAELVYKYFVGDNWNTGDPVSDRKVNIADADVEFNDQWNNNACVISVQENALSLVSMYPNPVSSELTIANLEGVNKVVVSNLLGQALVTKNVSASTMTINTADFKAGIYVVTVVSANGATRSERIVKE